MREALLTERGPQTVSSKTEKCVLAIVLLSYDYFLVFLIRYAFKVFKSH